MRHFWERYFSFCDRAGKDRYGKQWLLRIIWPLKKARPFIFLRLMLQIRLYFTNKRSPGSAPVWIKSNTRKHVEKDSTAKPLEMFALHRALSGILTQINTSCYLLSSFFFLELESSPNRARYKLHGFLERMLFWADWHKWIYKCGIFFFSLNPELAWKPHRKQMETLT